MPMALLIPYTLLTSQGATWLVIPARFSVTFSAVRRANAEVRLHADQRRLAPTIRIKGKDSPETNHKLHLSRSDGPKETRSLPSSSSFSVGASRQIMLGGCLVLKRSFCASCKSRRSLVVSSNFCWTRKASATERNVTQVG